MLPAKYVGDTRVVWVLCLGLIASQTGMNDTIVGTAVTATRLH